MQARDEEFPSAAKATLAPRRWYGLPILIVDVVGLGMLGLGTAVDSDGLFATGAVVSVTGAMVIHVAYHWTSNIWLGLGKGLLSAVGRGGLGFGLCMAGTGCNQMNDRAALRFGGGVAIAAALDIAFLAWKREDAVPGRAALGLAPLASRDAVGATVAGAF